MNPIAILECPEDVAELTELYCLGRLSTLDKRSFEAHLKVCPACQVEVFDTEVFLHTLIAALREREICDN